VSDFDGTDSVTAQVKQNPISAYKVFSVTKARDREQVGDRISTWLETNPQLEIRQAFVRMSSDSAFHCWSLVLVCADR
jgi:1,2-phenylacetyl-CoA epoxidase catalytic subunit